MKTYQGSRTVEGKIKRSVVTLGVFDGVHLGHQQLLKHCRARAKRLKTDSVIYTFDPHPVRILFPEACPLLIHTMPQKLELIGKYGIDICVVEPFTKRFSQLKPESFFKRILVERLKTQELIVGYDFTFGLERRGTIATLQGFGDKFGVKIHIVDAFLKNGHLISSTVIRKEIQEGEIRQANLLLGRSYFIDGRVIPGDGLGRQLGFPTANLEVDNELLPAFGVYATQTRVGLRRYNSVTNVGARPTFCGKEMRIETHILNWNRQITGRSLRLEFLSRLRPERQFSGPEELITQINKDILRAREFFKRKHT